MENLLSEILPYINLGVAGLLIGLLIGRVLVTKKEMDESMNRDKSQYEKRLADKDDQIKVLQEAVKADSETNGRLAVAWEAAMAVINRQNRERNGS